MPCKHSARTPGTRAVRAADALCSALQGHHLTPALPFAGMFLRVAQVLYNDAEVCEEDAFFAWQDDTAEEVSSKQTTHA